MFCYKCGKIIDDDAEFCRYCGAKINEIPTEEQTDSASETKTTEEESGAKPNKKQVPMGLILGLIGVVVLIIVLVLVLGGNQKETDSTYSEEATSANETEDSITDSETETDELGTDEESENDTKEEVTIETIYMSTENMRPTILETSGIKVRFNKFNYANEKSVYGVNFIVENDTDEEISVVLTDVTVNGYDVSTSTGKTLVKPGHKANCDSSVWQKYIDETSQSEWDVINGVIEICEGYWGEALYSVPVIIDKACWEYEEEYAENNPITPIISSDLEEIPEGAIVLSSGNLYPVLVDEGGVTASVSSYGYANGKSVFKLNFTMENNTDEDLSIALTDVIVDGYDISTSQGKTLVEAGHKSVCDSSVWMRNMEEVGINDWIVLKGNVEVSEGYWGDTIYSIPVVIYRDAWTSAA